ncbi:MAG: hypothetical protein HZA52_18390 [Planctomycetes bacterium]|nr:hypothetical protein [Planctomycetota bacterium]
MPEVRRRSALLAALAAIATTIALLAAVRSAFAPPAEPEPPRAATTELAPAAVPAPTSEFECALIDHDVELATLALGGRLGFETGASARLEAHARRHGWRLDERVCATSVTPPGGCDATRLAALLRAARESEHALCVELVRYVAEALSRNGRHDVARELYVHALELVAPPVELELGERRRLECGLALASEELLLGRYADARARVVELESELAGRVTANTGATSCGFCNTPHADAARHAAVQALALRLALAAGDFDAALARTRAPAELVAHAFVFDGEQRRTLVEPDVLLAALASRGIAVDDAVRAACELGATGWRTAPLAEVARDPDALSWRVLRASELELATEIGTLNRFDGVCTGRQRNLICALVASGRDCVGRYLAAERERVDDEVVRRTAADRYATWLVYWERRQ